jgi:Protein of unknown function (DUF1800)/PA14 domain/CHRD domain
VDNYLNQTIRRTWLLAVSCLIIMMAGTVRSPAQMLDLNGNGISDVWELMYGASGIDPNADSDGDGVINGLEAIAGTNPFDSNSVPKISSFNYTNAGFSVTFLNAWGKFYQLQSVQILGDTNWVNETNMVARSGSVSTLTAPADTVAKYFRMVISDTNSDASGMNDWEKYQLGLDPFNPSSNGQLDGNGQPINDYSYVTNKLASQDVVAISAADPVTTQPDPGQNATDLGVLTLSRGGFPLDSITVNLGLNGTGIGFATAGLDYVALPNSVTLPAGISSINLNVTPLADTNLLTPVVAAFQLLPGSGYSLSGATNANILIYPSITPNGTGLIGLYFTNSSVTYASVTNFNPANFFLTRTDAIIDFNWTNGTSPNLSNGFYTVRWVGQVQPQYSETYYFVANTDDGVKLWVNDKLIIDNWIKRSSPGDSTGIIALQGGVHYDLKMEYFNSGSTAAAHLSWYSASQPKQVIPGNRLYPTNNTTGIISPTVITSPLQAFAFLGQPFTFTVTAANLPIGFGASGLPPGLSITSSNGVIVGTPMLAGDFQVTLTATNAVSTNTSILDLQVIDSGNSVVQEVWTGVAGTNVSDIPTGTPANITNTLATLEGVTDYGDNYGERIRGYLTAPVTGNYYFWIAGSDSAELWISDDSEPVNKIRRGYVTPGGTASRQWTNQINQKSAWLALTAGQKYYIEILHKAGSGAGDNFSVGWLQDPTGTNTAPAGVVPGYVLSRYYPPLPATIPGTLYSANLLALPGVASTGVGSATLRLNADNSQATLTFQVNNLVGGVTDENIGCDPYLASSSQVLYDISVFKPQANGSYLWTIKATSTLSVADIIELLKEGKATINIQSSAFPNGEISGHFTLANGTQIFTPPPAPPTWADDHGDSNAAARFLIQATYGSSSNDIASVQSLGYDAWINNQFALPTTHHLPLVLTNVSPDPNFPYPSALWFNTWWQQSVTAPDQLRQRVALALSEIMVVSQNGVLQDNARALSSYYDTLLDNSFGNFRALLKAVTLAPAMGLYLNMQANDVGSLVNGTHPNENYAREVQQLFSVGLNRMWPDGTLVINSQNNLVPTYNQNVVMGFASVFTGWNYYQTNQTNGQLPKIFNPNANYTNPMVLVPAHHELGAKLLLDNVVLPPAWGSQTNSSSTNFDNYGLQDLESAMDSLYNNPNVGTFICRQLIQRLVTSNPSRDYLYRVVQKFNDNGSGVRGDMQAVIKAILLDYEARSPNLLAAPTYGKQREPLLRVTAIARAFPSPPNTGATYAESGTQTITVTTPAPHRLNNNDVVSLVFTDTSGNPAPPSQNYSVIATGVNTFTVAAPNLLTGSYAQNTNVITVNVSGHGLLVSNAVYLVFTTGGAVNGLYQVVAVNSSSSFTVATPDNAVRSGNCLLPKISASGFTQSGTNFTVSCAGPHGLTVNETFYIPANTVLLTSGQYQVVSVPDPTHFTFFATNSTGTQSAFILYPLGPQPLSRSGNALLQWNTWNMGQTDNNATYNLAQSPLNANTVFNFYFPSFEFPGALASAGLTTPEFQLTSDTSVALQMNFLEAGILTNSSTLNANTNGLSSFNNGNGAITLDIGPWMTTNYTASANVPTLVDNLNSLLLAGQLSAQAKTNMVNYVTNTVNFPYATPPTQTQMRDRVRGVVHLLINSPDFTIQK